MKASKLFGFLFMAMAAAVFAAPGLARSVSTFHAMSASITDTDDLLISWKQSGLDGPVNYYGQAVAHLEYKCADGTFANTPFGYVVSGTETLTPGANGTIKGAMTIAQPAPPATCIGAVACSVQYSLVQISDGTSFDEIDTVSDGGVCD